MKRVLVTGATGFAGRHLCAYLWSKGYKVLGTFHRSKPADNSRPWPLELLEITDPSRAERLLGQFRPNFICHLAGQSSPQESWKDPEETFVTNVAGTINLLRAVWRKVPEARFLFSSSVHVHGEIFFQKPVVKENDAVWPLNPYGASKALAEMACLHFKNQFGIPVIIARAFNHMGRGQKTTFVFSDWCRQVALIESGRKRPVLEVGNLAVVREFLHVQDVVRAYECLMRKGRPGQIYPICTGRGASLKTYADFLVRKAFRPLVLKVNTKKLRRREPLKMLGSPAKIKALGWRPRFSAFDALEELLTDWREKMGSRRAS